MRAQHLVGIELFRARQRLRGGNAGAEALPRDYRRDRIEGVLPALARGNQRGADAGVEANLLVNSTAIGLKGPGMPVLGLAEHGSDEPVEQIDSLIRQDGAQIERHGYQGRMTALTFVSGDMLCRGATGLAGELGKARLGYAMLARGINADRANLVQALYQAEPRGRLCCLQHQAQPDEPALDAFCTALRQCIELPPLLGRQPAGQPPFDFPTSLKAELDTEAFK